MHLAARFDVADMLRTATFFSRFGLIAIELGDDHDLSIDQRG